MKLLVGERRTPASESVRPLGRWLNTPAAAVVVVAVLYGLFIWQRLAASDFDSTTFVLAGSAFTDPSLVPTHLRMGMVSGYDGQFYFRLALDPFTSTQTDHGIKMDSPAYRQQRILIPLVVHVLSLGHAHLVAPLFVLINYAAICCLAWIAARFARSLGRHALWGLMIPLYPGFLFSVSRNLVEVVEACFLVGGLLLLRERRSVLAAVALTLAVLTRETALLVAVGVLAVQLVAIRRGGVGVASRSMSLVPALAPMLVYAAWQAWLFAHWGRWPFIAGGSGLRGPLSGLMTAILARLPFPVEDDRLWLVEVGLLAAMAVAVLTSFRLFAKPTYARWSWLLYVPLVLSFTNWRQDVAFLRAASEFYVLGALTLLETGVALRFVMLLYSAGLWLVLFARGTV